MRFASILGRIDTVCHRSVFCELLSIELVNTVTAFQSVDAFAELYYTMEAIKLVTGVTPTCWRPPYGDVDDRIRAIANALGLRTIIWKYDSNDWRVGTGNITNVTVDMNYQNLVTNATNGTYSSSGTIMLTHELNNYTMQEAMKWYPMLMAAFQRRLVPIGVALNITQPYVETDYTLPNFADYLAGTITGNHPATTPTPTLPSPGFIPSYSFVTVAPPATGGPSSSSGSHHSSAIGLNVGGVVALACVTTLTVIAGSVFLVSMA
jgi:hypothetical protein